MSQDTYASSGGPALVQNRKAQAHYLFATDAAARSGHHQDAATAEAGEADEMEMRLLKRKHSRSSPLPSVGQEEGMTFVVHVVEAHHTLRGIALQYRVPVEDIKRMNLMWNDDELHTRKTLKIPADPNGLLYYAVMNDKLEELLDDTSGTDTPPRNTFTTKNLMKPTDHLPRDHNDSEQQTSKQFLEKLDSQLSEVIKSQERIAHELEAQGQAMTSSQIPYGVSRAARRQPNPLTTWMPQDWRVVALVLILVAVLGPVVFYIIEPKIVAPPPHQP